MAAAAAEAGAAGSGMEGVLSGIGQGIGQGAGIFGIVKNIFEIKKIADDNAFDNFKNELTVNKYLHENMSEEQREYAKGKIKSIMESQEDISQISFDDKKEIARLQTALSGGEPEIKSQTKSAINSIAYAELSHNINIYFLFLNS